MAGLLRRLRLMPFSRRLRSVFAQRRLGLQALEERAVPATFTVNELDDNGTGAGAAGDIRYCLANASAGDVIQFSPTTFATPQSISVSSQLSITKNLTISGPGFDGSNNPLVTIANIAAAASTSRVLNIASGLTVNISGVTIAGGNVNGTEYGGGILSLAAKLTLDNCVVTGSTAHFGGALAVYQYPGQLVLNNCTISGNHAVGGFSYGGGIYMAGSTQLTMTGTTISGNTAAVGGGIFFFSGGAFSITNSTLSGNTATGAGGALYFYGAATGPLIVQNSTVSGNVAGIGGGLYFSANATLAPFLSSSLVAGNSGLYPDLSFSGPTIVSGGDNLVGVADGGNFTFSGTNMTGTASAPLDPLLDALANNGGLTKTHALQAGSPAIDAGNNNAGLNSDQRGVDSARNQGLKTDIGAFESANLIIPWAYFGGLATIVAPGSTPNTINITYQDANAINVSSIGIADIEIIAPDNSLLTITDATVSLNTNGSPRTATYTFIPPGGTWDAFDRGVYKVNIVADRVADIDPPQANTVPAAFIGTFQVNIGAALVVDEPTDFDDGNYSSLHLSLREALKISNTLLPDSVETITFASFVSKIFLTNGTYIITDPVVINGPGAGKLTIDAQNDSRHFFIDVSGNADNFVSISGLTLINGSVDSSSGGSIFNDDAALSLSGVTIADCTATNGSGGAIAVFSSVAGLNLVDCTLTGNVATSFSGGGAIYVATPSTVSITHSSIVNNSTSDAGGGIYLANPANLTVTSSTFSGNSSGRNGGAIAAVGGNLTIINSTISGNSATTAGGVWLSSSAGTLTVNNSTLAFNTASANNGVGGVLVDNRSTSVTLSSTIVARNSGSKAPDLSVPPGLVIAGGNNLIGVLEVGNFKLSGANVFGTRAAPLDPLLAPLDKNGGPTVTHGLTVGSPAIDAGAANGLTDDQRGAGFPRVAGAAADVGAFEGSVTIPVGFFSGPGTIITAGTTPNTITIKYVDDSAIKASTFDISDITITGPNATTLTITGFTVDTPGDGSPRTVTYTFAVPGGAWDPADNGAYKVTQSAGAVTDTGGAGVLATTFGAFQVAVGNIYVVDVTNDVDNGNTTKGDLSLREAIGLANANNLGFADVITFDPLVFAAGTKITLANGNFLITDPVVIQGPGAGNLTIDGALNSRIFDIDLINAGAVSLSGLTLTNGRVVNVDGGAIRNANAVLTVAAAVITGNQAVNLIEQANGGAIALMTSNATLTVIDSTINNNEATGTDTNGGAICAFGDSVVNIVRSTISGNESGEDGGGLYFLYGGDLSVIDSTISGNKSNMAQVGLGGAGIYLSGTRAVIRNSTISGNSTSAGGFASPGGGIAAYQDAAVVIQNSTVVLNVTNGPQGGGIVISQSAVTIESSIFANNQTSTGPDIFGPVLLNNSLVTSMGGFTQLPGSGNNVFNQDPLLEALANNGGTTLTHALKSGSPALNVGSNPANLNFDQRGVARNVGGVDIGAYELASATPAAKVTSVVINGGDPQRSRVTTVTINFDSAVSFTGAASAAFDLKRQADSAAVTVTATPNGTNTAVTLTFTGGPVDGKAGNLSLADGRYTLTLLATQFAGGGLDGDGNGIAGDNYVLASAPSGNTPTNIFRRFGDINADGIVNGIDFLQFRLRFLQSFDAFDFDGDGTVNGPDFLKFRLVFLSPLP